MNESLLHLAFEGGTLVVTGATAMQKDNRIS